MGLSPGYNDFPDKDEAFQLTCHAYALACTFFDKAEESAMGANEVLVGLALKDIRGKIVLATKFRVEKSSGDNSKDFTLKEIRKHLEDSIKRLGKDHIDLYYLNGMSMSIPLEDDTSFDNLFIATFAGKKLMQKQYGLVDKAGVEYLYPAANYCLTFRP